MALASGTAGSVVWQGTLVARTRSWEINPTMEPVDVTTQGVSWQEFVAGLRGYTVSAELLWDMADPAQAGIQNSLLTGAAGSVRLYANASNYYEGSTVFPVGLTATSAHDAEAEASVEFQGSGPLSYN